MINIGIDLYGNVRGINPILIAVEKYLKIDSEVNIVIIGNRNKILNFFHNKIPNNLKIIEGKNTIKSDDNSLSFRSKLDSSLMVGLNLLKKRKINTFISSCNTAVYLTAAGTLFNIKNQIIRPGFAVVSVNKFFKFICVDVGGNLTLKPINYLWYGIEASKILKNYTKEEPKVGILNISNEHNKGRLESQEAYKILKKHRNRVNFMGFIQPQNIFNKKCNVLLSNGHDGNLVIKSIEGIYIKLKKNIILELNNAKINIIKKILLKKSYKKILQDFPFISQYSRFSQIIGINALCFKVHSFGNYKSYFGTIKNAIIQIKQKKIISVKHNPELKSVKTHDLLLSENIEKIKPLLKEFRIKTNNYEIYVKSLTHVSWTHDNPSFANNFNYERLEHTGDKTVNYYVTRYIDKEFPDYDQGQVSKITSRIISNKNLARIAHRINLNEYIFCGSAIKDPLKSFSDKIWASFFEGFIGAIKNDLGDNDFCQKIIENIINNIIIPHAKENGLFNEDKDYKTQLQEYLRKEDSHVKIQYKTLSRFQKNGTFYFTEALLINDKEVSIASETKKKAAHQKIAEKYLNFLNSNH